MKDLKSKNVINNVIFQKIEEFELEEKDSRFVKAKIWILHTGRNYNGSVFSKEVVDKARPTLANTPIMCFYEKNKNNEDDFSDHRYVLENGDFVCKEVPIGVITETNAKNSYWEKRLCDDGIEREFLVSECILWTKWNRALDIFEKQNVKGQSMELADDYEGHFEKDGFHFDEFKFNGCTVLGDDVLPAMENSHITTNFSQEENSNIAKEIENKLNEFNKYFSKKEDEPVKDNKEFENQEKKVELENSEKDNEEIVKPEVDNETEKQEDNEKDTVEDETENDKKDNEEVETKEACGKKKKYSLNFELSHEDIRSQIYDKLCDLEIIEGSCYGIVKTKDDYFIYVDFDTNEFYKQSYSKTDDTVEFVGEREQIFELFVDKETKDKIESVSYSKLEEELESSKQEVAGLNSKISEYSKQNKELSKFKAERLEQDRKDEINSVISEFSNVNSLDLESYKLKAYNKEFKDCEELRNAIYSAIGRQNFSRIKSEEIMNSNEKPAYKMHIEEKTNCPYEGLEKYFNKNN